MTFLDLLKRWRLAPEFSALPFANFVDMCDDLRTRLAERAQHQETCWQELTGQIRTDLFPTSGPAGAAP